MVAFCGSAFGSRASATERHFTYTYETGVLNPGDAELEPWTTYRTGGDYHLRRYDLRLEYEVGLRPDLQTSLYWNFESSSMDVTDATGSSVRVRETQLASVSSEWKYRLTDPVADAFGSALYLEGTLGPSEYEIEGKLLLDKRMDKLVLALNLVGAHEVESQDADTTLRDLELEASAALAYRFTPHVSVGAEVVSLTELEDAEELESSVVFLGPTVGVQMEKWWTAFSLITQVAAPKGATSGGADLAHHDRFQGRVLIGFRL